LINVVIYLPLNSPALILLPSDDSDLAPFRQA